MAEAALAGGWERAVVVVPGGGGRPARGGGRLPQSSAAAVGRLSATLFARGERPTAVVATKADGCTRADAVWDEGSAGLAIAFAPVFTPSGGGERRRGGGRRDAVVAAAAVEFAVLGAAFYRMGGCVPAGTARLSCLLDIRRRPPALPVDATANADAAADAAASAAGIPPPPSPPLDPLPTAAAGHGGLGATRRRRRGSWGTHHTLPAGGGHQHQGPLRSPPPPLCRRRLPSGGGRGAVVGARRGSARGGVWEGGARGGAGRGGGGIHSSPSPPPTPPHPLNAAWPPGFLFVRCGGGAQTHVKVGCHPAAWASTPRPSLHQRTPSAASRGGPAGWGSGGGSGGGRGGRSRAGGRWAAMRTVCPRRLPATGMQAGTVSPRLCHGCVPSPPAVGRPTTRALRWHAMRGWWVGVGRRKVGRTTVCTVRCSTCRWPTATGHR